MEHCLEPEQVTKHPELRNRGPFEAEQRRPQPVYGFSCRRESAKHLDVPPREAHLGERSIAFGHALENLAVVVGQSGSYGTHIRQEGVPAVELGAQRTAEHERVGEQVHRHHEVAAVPDALVERFDLNWSTHVGFV